MGDSNTEPTSPRSPLAPFPPYRIQERSRAPEIYGFVAYTSTSVLFILYVLWALLPDSWILAIGIDWYPNREWANLLPAYSAIMVILTYFTYWALALYLTPSFESLSTITDARAHVAEAPVSSTSEKFSNPYLAAALPDAIPHMYDLPIGLVNRILYDVGSPTVRSGSTRQRSTRSASSSAATK
ncbi:PIG-P-domain-containing protein [Schizopora paradoxa]|uniref:PIG-P-domain-containing protein n=1 Tax=Schizopora paradoxa TaxID=27342 RepID=A0A0H2SQL8_9AGAM|nr:PIG-P-domain-containing protein [Schizopora paradoxa]